MIIYINYNYKLICIVASCKDSNVATIQNSIMPIQNAEYNNYMLEWEQIHPDITVTMPVQSYVPLLFCDSLHEGTTSFLFKTAK